MPLDIDPALIALVPAKIIEAALDYGVASNADTGYGPKYHLLLTLIGALVRERDEATVEVENAAKLVRIAMEELVLAGFPGGDRTVLLANIRSLVLERAELLVAARRYETVRKLNPREFAGLYERNITSGERFDDLVDALAVDIPASWNR